MFESTGDHESRDYAAIIRRHWQRCLPCRLASVRNPDRVFAVWGARMRRRVVERATALACAYVAALRARGESANWDGVWAAALFTAESEAFQRLLTDVDDRLPWKQRLCARAAAGASFRHLRRRLLRNRRSPP